MSCKRKAIVFIIITVIMYLLAITINADVDIDRSNIDVYDISDSEKNNIAGSLNLRILSNRNTQYEDNSIVSFDVSDTGMLAIIFDDGTVVVKTKDDKVYSVLKISGHNPTLYRLDWNGDYIDIVSTRYGNITSITVDGEIVDAERFNYTSKTKDYLHYLKHECRTIECDEYTYSMKNSNMLTNFLGGSVADKLIRVDKNGNEIIVFESEKEVSDSSYGGILMVIAIFVLAPLFFLVVFLNYYKKQHKSNNTGDVSMC